MTDREIEMPHRIPVRFIDAENSPESTPRRNRNAPDSMTDSTMLTPQEIKDASIYGDAAEEESDHAGSEHPSEIEATVATRISDSSKNRNDPNTITTTTTMTADSSIFEDENGSDEFSETTTAASPSGSHLAELLATRAELKRVEAEWHKADAERKTLLDQLARGQADFNNFRKRAERERGDAYNRTVGEVVKNLLPVVDNLRRALDAQTVAQKERSNEFRNLLEGVELTYKQLNDVLEGMGLRPVPTVGHQFDPHLHEAVTTEHSDEYPPDTVVQEIVRGYTLGDKLLRPAMVKVATPR